MVLCSPSCVRCYAYITSRRRSGTIERRLSFSTIKGRPKRDGGTRSPTERELHPRKCFGFCLKYTTGFYSKQQQISYRKQRDVANILAYLVRYVGTLFFFVARTEFHSATDKVTHHGEKKTQPASCMPSISAPTRNATPHPWQQKTWGTERDRPVAYLSTMRRDKP